MAPKFRREHHALFISCAHSVLPQISCRVGHKILVKGSVGSDLGADTWDCHANLCRNWRPYRETRTGPRPCAYVLSIPPKLSLSNVILRIKSRSFCRIKMQFTELRKRYWGRRFWARGYFSTFFGNVTDDIITQYLELYSSKWCYRR